MSEHQNQTQKTLGEVVVVTSGKGGVGKTTSSAAIGFALAQRGFKTVVVDFDVGLRNIDLVMGCERRVVYDLINLINKESNLNQTLIKDKRNENLYILPASQTRDKDALEKDGLNDVMDELQQRFDYIVCDSPAGIEKGALMAMYYADQAIIITNPEISSVRDSDRIIGVLDSKTRLSIEKGQTVPSKLIVTRYNPERVEIGEMLSIEDISDVLSIDLIGVIPESESVLQASNSGIPVTAYDQSDASKAYHDAIERFLGKNIPMRFIQQEKKGLFKKIFGGKH